MALGATSRGAPGLSTHVGSIGPPSLGRVAPLALRRVARILARPPWSGAIALWWIALVRWVARPLLWVALWVAMAIGRNPLARLVHVGWGAHLWLPGVSLRYPRPP